MSGFRFYRRDGGEKIVIRILRRGRQLMTLAQLGIQPEAEERLHALIRRQGMLLVVGPTGSGKTRSLYAFVNEIRQEPMNIVTIEDPVEYEVDGIGQVPVNDKTGLTFLKALRSILRQEPHVILVGEIRDSDTAITAFHAAMTGHLVMSTLHSTDAISALLRSRDWGWIGQSLPQPWSELLGRCKAQLHRLRGTGFSTADLSPASAHRRKPAESIADQ